MIEVFDADGTLTEHECWCLSEDLFDVLVDDVVCDEGSFDVTLPDVNNRDVVHMGVSGLMALLALDNSDVSDDGCSNDGNC